MSGLILLPKPVVDPVLVDPIVREVEAAEAAGFISIVVELSPRCTGASGAACPLPLALVLPRSALLAALAAPMLRAFGNKVAQLDACFWLTLKKSGPSASAATVSAETALPWMLPVGVLADAIFSDHVGNTCGPCKQIGLSNPFQCIGWIKKHRVLCCLPEIQGPTSSRSLHGMHVLPCPLLPQPTSTSCLGLKVFFCR